MEAMTNKLSFVLRQQICKSSAQLRQFSSENSANAYDESFAKAKLSLRLRRQFSSENSANAYDESFAKAKLLGGYDK
jgi:hypothetical protein